MRQPYLYFSGWIGAKPAKFMVDTGATISVIHKRFQSEINEEPIGPPVYIVGVNNTRKKSIGEFIVRIRCEENVWLKLKMHSANELEFDGLIGLKSMSAIAKGIQLDDPYLRLRTGRKLKLHVGAQDHESILEFEDSLFGNCIIAKESCCLAPGQRKELKVAIQNWKPRDGFIRVINTCSNMLELSAISTSGAEEPTVLVENNGHQILQITTGNEIGQGNFQEWVGAFECKEAKQSLNQDSLDVMEQKVHFTEEEILREKEQLLRKAINPTLPLNDQNKIFRLLWEYKEQFSTDHEPITRSVHEAPPVELNEKARPFKARLYRLPAKDREAIDKQLDEWLQSGIVQPSKSEYASGLVVVQKGHHDAQGRVLRPRIVCDLRPLNEMQVPIHYPTPQVDFLLSQLEGCSLFNSMDMRKGFYQIRRRPQDRKFFSFICHRGTFEFTAVVMGDLNSMAIFQKAMEQTFSSLDPGTVQIYADDVFQGAQSIDVLLTKLRKTLECIKTDGWKISAQKCLFGMNQLKVLGFLVSDKGIGGDPEKIRSIQEFQRPSNLKTLRSFLGLASFYRRHIYNFACIAKPLNKLLEKDAPFDWGPEQEEAFTQLKFALSSAPVLRHFDPALPIRVYTDASAWAIAGIITNTGTDGERVISYASRSLTPRESKYSTIEREYLALVFSLQKFRCYLLGNPFSLLIDHCPLLCLNKASNGNPRILRWFMMISEYQFRVFHKPGKEHRNADGLSRMPEDITNGPEDGPTGRSEIVYRLSPLRLSRSTLREMQEEDTACQKYSKGALEPGSKFIKQEGLLYRSEHGKIRLVVPSVLRRQLLKESHDSKISGHGGYRVTLMRMYNSFWFPKMRSYVAKYVMSCEACQKAKRPIRKPQGMLQPIAPPDKPGSFWSIDVAGPLPRTANGNRYIIIAVDLLSKLIVAEAVTNYSATTTARFILERIVCIHGPPDSLLSDRGGNFLSKQVDNLLRSIGTSRKLTSGYAPSTNGLCERTIGSVKQALRTFLENSSQDKWDEYLHPLVYALNTAYKPSVRKTPFEITYARVPRPIGAVSSHQNPEKRTRLEQLHQADTDRKKSREAILKAQAAYTKQYNRSHTETKYKVGDIILINNPATPPGLAPKLTKHWEGPYIVTNVLSPLVLKATRINNPKVKRTVNIRRVKPFHEVYESDEEFPDLAREDDELTKPKPKQGDPGNYCSSASNYSTDDEGEANEGQHEGVGDEEEGNWEQGAEEPQEHQDRLIAENPPNPVPAGTQLKTGRISHPPIRFPN